ncbi:hypothetical protein C8R47DRAFT_1313772 [Mycena vitilis]|nr:hypothetical protein C8R47DRAFT_1313772 [Mycena vitilis]
MPARSQSSSHALETPYNDHLHTNFVPSDQECSRIRDLVELSTQELGETTAEITKLQASLDRMTRRQEQLEEFIDSHLALVSGARRLPQDILGEIFMASLPANDYASMHSSTSPLLISHICGEWRRIAFSMPRLWRSLRIGWRSTCSHKVSLEAVNHWLDHSGSLTVSISVSTSFPRNLLPNAEFGRNTLLVFKRLVECSLRWEHIQFGQLSLEPLAVLAQLSPLDVPALKTASIGARAATVLSFLSAPNIRRLSLRSATSPCLDTPLHVSHISLRGLTSTDAFQILRLCPALEKCTLAVRGVLPGEIGTHPIRLECMQHLHIINDYEGRTHFFDHIVLPHLRSLEYCNDATNAASREEMIAVLDSLCAPEILTNLSLSSRIPAAQLANVLRPFTVLQQIFLHCPRNALLNGVTTCSLFPLLTPSSLDPAEVLCPRLRSICSLGLDPGSDAELLELLNTRRAMTGIQTLSNVYVAFPRELQMDILPLLPNDALTIDLHYRDAEDAKLIRERVSYRYYQIPRSTVGMRRPPSPPDTLQLRLWRQDLEADWGPISREWLAEYDEWGLGEDEEEEKEKEKGKAESEESEGLSEESSEEVTN